MPGESPGRDWDALLEPEKANVFEQRRRERKLAAIRRRSKIWTGFTVVVIAVVMLGWFSLLPWAAPSWVSMIGWGVLLPVLLFITVFILRRLERRFLPGQDQALLLES